MIFTAAVMLFLTHAVSLSAMIYQLLNRSGVPLMAQLKTLAIIYGVYAIGKIIMSVRRTIKKRDQGLYAQTLSYIGWITAVYTLGLFTDYLLISNQAYTYLWPKYMMISAMGLITIGMAVLMLIKSTKALREIKSEATG